MANIRYCGNPYRAAAKKAEERTGGGLFGLFGKRKEAGEGDVQNAAERFGRETAERAVAYHKGFPEYAETPLVNLKRRAKELGLGGLYVKDESYRFGLNAFKVLGGSYAVGRIVAEWIERNAAGLSPEETMRKLAELTLITATDGNHGRGVAWAAKRFGAKAVVYLPKGSAEERVEAIRALGAETVVTDCSYDDTVRLAAETAVRNGGLLVQDTAWEGYETVPRQIMEGYTTMALEAVTQLERLKEELREKAAKNAADSAGEPLTDDAAVETRPTHVFLQAGVGAMAGAVAGFLTSHYGENAPRIFIVEPEKADCFYRTAEANDGRIHAYDGEMDTIMAGLACGEPCTLGWEVLRDVAEGFFAIPDAVAEDGMRLLGLPAVGDPAVISGESGAATAGLVAELLRNPEHRALREAVGLDETARVLLISTEGATDSASYNRIVYNISVAAG